MSLVKPEDSSKKKDEQPPKELEEVVMSNVELESDVAIERNKSVPNIPEKIDKQESEKERAKSEGPPKIVEKQGMVTNGPVLDSQK